MSELNRNVLDTFNEYDVQIMTPSYEGDPETPKSRWFAAPAGPRAHSERKSVNEMFKQAG